MMSVCAIYGEGAPSLRFLQGRVTMLPTQLLWPCNPVTHAFQFPPFAKCAKDGAPSMVFCASEVTNPGYPPAALSVESPPFRKRSVGHPPAAWEKTNL